MTSKLYYGTVYNELSSGRACIIQVNGGGGNRHFVTAIGYKKGKTASTITETDILIIDTWDSKLEALVGENQGGGRFLFNQERDCGYGEQYLVYLCKSSGTVVTNPTRPNVVINYNGSGGLGKKTNQYEDGYLISETFYSEITKLTHKIIYHGNAFGSGECNKGAAFAIASAYISVGNAKTNMPENGCLSEGAGGSATAGYFDDCGLNVELKLAPGSYTEFSKELPKYVAEYLPKGGYVTFWLSTGTTVDGDTWANQMHHIAVLSVKKENGVDYMYVAEDSWAKQRRCASSGDPNTYRWVPINYFDGTSIGKIWLITQAK